jgi:hypothetical protein
MFAMGYNPSTAGIQAISIKRDVLNIERDVINVKKPFLRIPETPVCQGVIGFIIRLEVGQVSEGGI